MFPYLGMKRASAQLGRINALMEVCQVVELSQLWVDSFRCVKSQLMRKRWGLIRDQTRFGWFWGVRRARRSDLRRVG